MVLFSKKITIDLIYVFLLLEIIFFINMSAFTLRACLFIKSRYDDDKNIYSPALTEFFISN